MSIVVRHDLDIAELKSAETSVGWTRLLQWEITIERPVTVQWHFLFHIGYLAYTWYSAACQKRVASPGYCRYHCNGLARCRFFECWLHFLPCLRCPKLEEISFVTNGIVVSNLRRWSCLQLWSLLPPPPLHRNASLGCLAFVIQWETVLLRFESTVLVVCFATLLDLALPQHTCRVQSL